MDILESISHLTDVANCFCLWQWASLFHNITKRFAINIIYNVVGCTILLKDIVHLHYVWMIHLEDCFSFLNELLAQFVH